VVAAVALVTVVTVIAAVLSGDDGARPTDRADAAGAATGAGDDGLPEAVAGLLDEMSDGRKVAQLMLVGLEGTDSGDPVFSTLEDRDYAGLVLDDRNYISGDQVEQLANEAVAVAEEADHVTPWVMAPQEGGEFNAFADLSPDDAPADIESPREAAEGAKEAAEALAEIGVTGVLAPVLDVGTETGGALGARLHSDDPDAVRDYGLAVLEEFEEADVFAAVKHFPGLGGASQSPEFGSANVGLSLEQLKERDLIPFEAAIETKVPGIVVGHGLYGVDDFVTPASMSKTIMTDLLRDDLGFEGVAIADDMTSPAITAGFAPADAAVDSVRSGADLVYVSVDDEQQGEVYDALLKAVRSEKISPERLDEAVTRTLVAKERLGLLDEEGESGGDGDDRGAAGGRAGR
jgi:beta-N-acetylhexosaminidase